MRLQNDIEPSSSTIRCIKRFEVIRSYLSENAVGAELGVFKGSFLDYLLSTKPRRLYAVDPWYRGEREWMWAMGDKSSLRALMKICDAFFEEITAGLLEPRVEFSSEFFSQMPDDSLDWVYIDTSHTYEHTYAELEGACRAVRPGGFIIGDDYHANKEHQHYGVYRAVKEFVDSGRLSLLVDGDFSQFVCRRM